MERPDLSQADEAIIAYIEYLEYELLATQSTANETDRREATESNEPSEDPTTVNVLTFSQQGFIKRTPRHFYSRQKRGGMGVFDLDMDEKDAPAQVILADESDEVLVLTNFARVFRLRVSDLPESDVRAKGKPLADFLTGLHDKERVRWLMGGAGAYIAVLSPRGYVFTKSKLFLKEGVQLYDTNKYGPPVAACWSSGHDDLFLATVQGKGIRFMEKQVPKGGILGMRLDEGDEFLAITAVREQSGVFMLSADGKGTIRLMSGFRQNKSPGAGGKVAIKSEQLVTAVTVDESDDIFVISRLGKMIRFSASDVPAKTGVVQGVNCMNLRADEVTAVGTAVL